MRRQPMHRVPALLLAFLIAALAPAAASAQERRIAITVDDLPAVASRDSDEVAFVTRTMIAALEAHGATAVGFVNSGKVTDQPQLGPYLDDVLRQWLAAGHEVGNHGAYHLSANDAPLAAFLADARAGDSLPRALSAAAGRPYRWYRLPYLHSGTSDSALAAIDSVFGLLQLRIAPVTVDARDWIYSAAWRTAQVQQDTVAMRRLGAAFVDFAIEMLAYHERLALKVAGRPIAQVLLLHANPMTALVLDDLLTRLHARKYAIVPLDVAVQDDVYARPDRYRGTIGLAWLERQAIYIRGVRVDDVPLPPTWVQALADTPLPPLH